MSLHDLPELRDYTSKRSSSWDTTGGNADFWIIAPGEKRVLHESNQPGCIRHIWMTIGGGGRWFLRNFVVRMWWDGEPHPSVEVPVGDFFGMGHGIHKNFTSAPLQMSPQDGRGMNCWFAMPYNAARIEIENQGGEAGNVYFYVDYEEYGAPHGENTARFHAQWRRENPTEGWLEERLNDANLWEVWKRNPSLDDSANYVILEAEGNGIYVGCSLSIDCFQRQGNDWYGEGDDMIVIDGEPWPPRLHGTGTEDYFCTAFGPSEELCAPYHGISLNSGTKEWPWKGKNTMYRFHIEDPIRFRKSIRVSIEHGHANKLSNDYCSTAYWYQSEPHKLMPQLISTELRIPRENEPQFP